MDLLRRAMSDPGDADAGWATLSLRDSMSRVFLAAVAVWQVVVVWAVLNTSAPIGERATLVAAHAALILLAVAASAGRFSPAVVLVLVYAVSVWDWAAADSYNSALSLAGCWSVNLAGAAAAFVVRGHLGIALPVASAVLLPPALYVVNPAWGLDLPLGIIVTQMAILVVTRVGLVAMMDFAALVDDQAAQAESEAERVAAAGAARSAAAEDARVLHDTVINTLGAIANGAAGLADPVMVRRRCAHDAEMADTLRAGLEADFGGGGLRAALARPGIAARRTGLSDADLDAVEARLPGEVVRMISRAVGELVQNAAKYSQASDVVVSFREVDDSLVVVVEDDGVGFAGDVAAGRGLRESVFARLRDVGVSVSIDTAPGQGVSVTLVRSLGSGEPSDGLSTHLEGRDFHEVVEDLRRRAAWLWSAGVAAVGLVLAVGSHPVPEEFAMVAVISVVSAIAWMSRGDDGQVSIPAVLLLAVGAAAGFLLGAAAVDFGRSDVVLWQAIGPTGLLVVILATRRGATAIRASVLLYALTVATATVVVGRESTDAAFVLPVGGAAALGFVAAWAAFQRAIVTIGQRAVDEQRAAFGMRVDESIRAAAERARVRWRAAGLHECSALLHGVAEGRLDPADDVVRAACAKEEAYLRQVIQLNPDLTRVGQWLARALNESRSRAGELVVRAGDDADAADDDGATALGHVLLGAVDTMSAETTLTATLFLTSEGLRMTLVSPHPGLADVERTWEPTPGSNLSYQVLGSQDVVEILLPQS